MNTITRILFTLCACVLFIAGCASAPVAETVKAGEYQIPDDVLSGSEGIDAEEAKAYASFAGAEFKRWSLDGGKFYLVDNGFYLKTQSEGPDWARDITQKKLAIIPSGSDNIISLDYGLSDGSKEIVYSFLFNISDQGTRRKDLSSTVMKVKFYIPGEMAADGASAYPIFRVVVRDGSWGQTFLSGDINYLTTKAIGAGWHVFIFDFANYTFKMGNASGKFDALSLASVNSVDFNFYAQDIPASMNVPMYMDWVAFDGLKDAQ